MKELKYACILILLLTGTHQTNEKHICSALKAYQVPEVRSVSTAMENTVIRNTFPECKNRLPKSPLVKLFSISAISDHSQRLLVIPYNCRGLLGDSNPLEINQESQAIFFLEKIVSFIFVS